MTNRAYYSASIETFLATDSEKILGALVNNYDFKLLQSQTDAWVEEFSILKTTLCEYRGSIYLEYSIPRMGKRIDAVLIIGPVIFVLEFKVGEKQFATYALDQVCDYALDLKNFHESSHDHFVAPVLIATKADLDAAPIVLPPQSDCVFPTIQCNSEHLSYVIQKVLHSASGDNIDAAKWAAGRYCPTPTIIEAAITLYKNHSVAEISRNDATATNLGVTSDAISQIISSSKKQGHKSICFVTGVPGAGKTLVGLNIATKYGDEHDDLHSVFLSGNGPLVSILCEALTRDKVHGEKERGNKIKKGPVKSEVKSFIQNVHHFRDECLLDPTKPPFEHVALFDEAQRAWNLQQTAQFMLRKKKKANFELSEPEFLIECMNRHSDWAVIVCLVGGGQEINTGEAGISEWISALNRSFPNWHIYVSSRLTDSEYAAGNVLQELKGRPNVNDMDHLHLSVSMRSFRSEHVSSLIKNLLDQNVEEAKNIWAQIDFKYPIVITRDLAKAKQWLKERARGSERYGIVVSSQADRLKPLAIDVNSPIDPIHWFLDGKEDVRSSYYLEDVATEFDIQGLELDWVCVAWDADFRYSASGWEQWSFVGKQWNRIKNPDRKNYLKNAYRVLLTRARQGMVIVVPPGDAEDPTRNPAFYDATFRYLEKIGFTVI